MAGVFEEQVKKASVRNDLIEADLDLCFWLDSSALLMLIGTEHV